MELKDNDLDGVVGGVGLSYEEKRERLEKMKETSIRPDPRK